MKFYGMVKSGLQNQILAGALFQWVKFGPGTGNDVEYGSMRVCPAVLLFLKSDRGKSCFIMNKIICSFLG